MDLVYISGMHSSQERVEQQFAKHTTKTQFVFILRGYEDLAFKSKICAKAFIEKQLFL